MYIYIYIFYGIDIGDNINFTYCKSLNVIRTVLLNKAYGVATQVDRKNL